jgi:hypothetical protein
VRGRAPRAWCSARAHAHLDWPHTARAAAPRVLAAPLSCIRVPRPGATPVGTTSETCPTSFYLVVPRVPGECGRHPSLWPTAFMEVWPQFSFLDSRSTAGGLLWRRGSPNRSARSAAAHARQCVAISRHLAAGVTVATTRGRPTCGARRIVAAAAGRIHVCGLDLPTTPAALRDGRRAVFAGAHAAPA